jgi:cytochrome c oxidase cbb3-type subunit I/II
MFSDLLSNLHFWGWQAIIVSAAHHAAARVSRRPRSTPSSSGRSTSRSRSSGSCSRSTSSARSPSVASAHLYVAIWFYIAIIVTVAVLHIVNSLSLPVAPLKSYSIYAGVQDALVQWWYGHNAVALLPDHAVPRPDVLLHAQGRRAPGVLRTACRILHFWALIFIYIWAGPHHLHYTALPDWAQTLGMVFSRHAAGARRGAA